MTAQTIALINEAIAYEEGERDAAPAEDRHFWDGWDPEKTRQGTPVVTVHVQAPGLGKVSIFSAHLMIKAQDGTYSLVREGYTERVATRSAARRNGLEGYAHRLAAKLYGAGLPVEYKHLV